jgi:NDP-sugar pyrophosphorylase family protein
MKSHGAKSLLPITVTKNLIEYQIDILNKTFNRPEIIVVVGFEADKVAKYLYQSGNRKIKIVENENFETTNIIRSIEMGMRISSYDKSLIINGNLLFNSSAFEGLITKKSGVLIDTKKRFKHEEVGVNIDKDHVVWFSYGLPTKWAQISYLIGKELNLFRDLITLPHKKKEATFEILNKVLDHGGMLRALEPENMKVKEINIFKDAKALN